MHKEKLEAIPNALAARADPEKAPEITGMDGIPELDYEEYKARRQAPLVVSATVGTTSLMRPAFGPVEPAPGTTSGPAPTTKKAKIDTPLDEGTIQAQLAEFQKKKEQEQVQHLISSGIVLPPGVPHNLVLSKFPTSPPPGDGPYAATKPSAAFASPSNPISNSSSTSGLVGKLESPAIPSSNSSHMNPNSASNPASNATPTSNATTPTSTSNAVKSVFLVMAADGRDTQKAVPPPSLKFTGTETIIKLTPPAPGSLAPGQMFHAGSTAPHRSATIGPQTGMTPMGGMQQGHPPNMGMGRGGMVPPYMGNQGMMAGRGFHPRGGARMQPLPAPYPPAYGRGMIPGRGTHYPYAPPPPPPQQQFNMGYNRGRGGGPRNMPGRPPFPQSYPPVVPAPAPLHLTPQGYTPYTGPLAPSPAPAPPASPYGAVASAGYAYPSQQQQYHHPPPLQQGYQNYAQAPAPYPPRPAQPPAAAQNVPFEVLYPMHGKRAPAMTPSALPSHSAGIPAGSAGISPGAAPPGMPLPSSLPPGYQTYQTPGSASPTGQQGNSAAGFFAPPLPSSTSPPSHPIQLGSTQEQVPGQSQVQGGKIDVRIISDDVVSPVLSPPLIVGWLIDL